MKALRTFAAYLLNPRGRYRQRLAGASAAAMEQAAPRPRLRLRTMTANLPLMVGLAIALGFTLVVLFGPLWASYDPYITIQTTLPHYDSELNQMVQPPFPPSADFPLGTDNWGNDLLSLLLYGARTTLVAAAYITLLRLVLGVALGFAAGWKAGGVVDQLVMGLVAALGSVPLLLSGMILIFALDIDNGLVVFLVALSALGWTEIAQYVRGELQVIRQMAYVEAARAGGLTALQIAVRHALPNILP
ncbi:MAG: ABC transporter permease subunit, partial [Chloroflexi bacterium]|nr:ABC transporter permease subunit [Chloroflexota bacterium]